MTSPESTLTVPDGQYTVTFDGTGVTIKSGPHQGKHVIVNMKFSGKFSKGEDYVVDVKGTYITAIVSGAVPVSGYQARLDRKEQMSDLLWNIEFEDFEYELEAGATHHITTASTVQWRVGGFLHRPVTGSIKSVSETGVVDVTVPCPDDASLADQGKPWNVIATVTKVAGGKVHVKIKHYGPSGGGATS